MFFAFWLAIMLFAIIGGALVFFNLFEEFNRLEEDLNNALDENAELKQIIIENA